MKKALKILAILAVVAVLCAAGLVAYLLFAVDPNSYKPRLEQAAREQGVDLTIAGDLGWRFFPALAIDVGQTRFASESHGIAPSSIETGRLALGWRELLQGRVAIKALAIDGADLHLTRGDAAGAAVATPATGDQPIESADRQLALAVDTLSLSNGRLRLEQADGTLLLDDIQLRLRDVSLDGGAFPVAASLTYHRAAGEPLDLALDTRLAVDRAQGQLRIEDGKLSLAGALPAPIALNFDGTVDGVIDGELRRARISRLDIALGDTHLTGSADYTHARPRALTLTLAGGDLDTAALLPPSANGDGSGEDGEGVDNPSDANPLAALLAPMAMLEGGSGRIDLALDSLRHGDLNLSAPRLGVDIDGPRVGVRELAAGIFGGQLAASGTLDAGRDLPRISFQQRLTGIDLGAALAVLAEDVNITGTLDLDFEGNTRGSDSEALLANLAGAGKLRLEDPVIATVNLEKSYCELAALVEKTPAREEPWPAGTRLNTLASPLRIADGILHLDDYSTGIGNLGVRGAGRIDLDRKTFDIEAITRLTGDRTSDEGCLVKSKRVRDRDIPLRCKDSFADAGAGSCKPDQAFVNSLVKDEVIDKIKEKTNLDDDKAEALEGLLKGLLNR
ncbi:MAG: AsmA family protein [Porticoccaceae bacterium]|jgi:uncharacterized protein involved in outer membrane biogenesis|nr:AsmA family protein [Porticoccaceae bacterium]